jgi:hypothetical protein
METIYVVNAVVQDFYNSFRRLLQYWRVTNTRYTWKATMPMLEVTFLDVERGWDLLLAKSARQSGRVDKSRSSEEDGSISIE